MDATTYVSANPPPPRYNNLWWNLWISETWHGLNQCLFPTAPLLNLELFVISFFFLQSSNARPRYQKQGRRVIPDRNIKDLHLTRDTAVEAVIEGEVRNVSILPNQNHVLLMLFLLLLLLLILFPPWRITALKHDWVHIYQSMYTSQNYYSILSKKWKAW